MMDWPSDDSDDYGLKGNTDSEDDSLPVMGGAIHPYQFEPLQEDSDETDFSNDSITDSDSDSSDDGDNSDASAGEW